MGRDIGGAVKRVGGLAARERHVRCVGYCGKCSKCGKCRVLIFAGWATVLCAAFFCKALNYLGGAVVSWLTGCDWREQGRADIARPPLLCAEGKRARNWGRRPGELLRDGQKQNWSIKCSSTDIGNSNFLLKREFLQKRD